jgi:hypothetical protein
VAYVPNLNGLFPAEGTLDGKTLAAMPNRGMFTSDPRPDVKNPACMAGVERCRRAGDEGQ